MQDEQLFLSTGGSGYPRIQVRDAADIKRLRLHLLTHAKRPGVEFRVDGLPAVESQRAQDRFARIYDACNCLIGELLGVLTLLAGSFMTWTTTRSWHDMGVVLLATAYAALMGKGVDIVWTRVKLLRTLRRLRRRLAGEEFDEVMPVHAPVRPFRVERGVAADDETQRPIAAVRRSRPSIHLRNIADINRLLPRLALPRALPRIEIRTDAIPTLDVQRAQTRIVRFARGCSYLLAGLLAVGVMLAGLLYQVWTGSQDWLYSERVDWWLLKLDWGDVWPVLTAALCAGLAGAALEMLWLRVQLVLVLRGLRQQLAR